MKNAHIIGMETKQSNFLGGSLKWLKEYRFMMNHLTECMRD
jgi:hypothetical protein